MNELQLLFAQTVFKGCQRKSIVRCSDWAQQYRIMGQPFPGPARFDMLPWSRGMHDCDAEMWVGQKSAQAGYTETALDRCLFSIDIKGQSVLYVLPTADHASDFSSSRFDVALEMSPHLQTIFSNTKNVGHKRAGSASLFVRGSQSRGKLKSDPVALIILDEVDEMNKDNIPLAFERLSGQVHQQKILISTPTIDNYGINGYFKDSSQNHFNFKCPHCGRLTELIFPDCLIITALSITDPGIKNSHIICKECRHKLDHEQKQYFLKDGIWVPMFEQRPIVGFHINQLYSSTVHPSVIAQLAIKAETDPASEQELYNSKLGMTKTVKGAKITETDIANRTISYQKLQKYNGGGLVTMGVDVGKWLHVEIDQYVFNTNDYDVNLATNCRILNELKVENFEELDDLMKRYNVTYCVIDANPERRKAKEFAQRFYGRVKLCYYLNNIKSRDMTIHDDEQCTIGVDRTSWLDISLGRFKQEKKIALPVDLSQEYKDHIQAMVRVYRNDKNGNPVGRYVTGTTMDKEEQETKGNHDDHFAHARNYAEIALPLACATGKNRDISGVV